MACSVDPSHVRGPVLSDMFPLHNHRSGRTEPKFTRVAKPQSHTLGLASSTATSCTISNVYCPSCLLTNASHSAISLWVSLSLCRAHLHVRSPSLPFKEQHRAPQACLGPSPPAPHGWPPWRAACAYHCSDSFSAHSQAHHSPAAGLRGTPVAIVHATHAACLAWGVL